MFCHPIFHFNKHNQKYFLNKLLPPFLQTNTTFSFFFRFVNSTMNSKNNTNNTNSLQLMSDNDPINAKYEQMVLRKTTEKFKNTKLVEKFPELADKNGQLNSKFLMQRIKSQLKTRQTQKMEQKQGNDSMKDLSKFTSLIDKINDNPHLSNHLKSVENTKVSPMKKQLILEKKQELIEKLDQMMKENKFACDKETLEKYIMQDNPSPLHIIKKLINQIGDNSNIQMFGYMLKYNETTKNMHDLMETINKNDEYDKQKLTDAVTNFKEYVKEHGVTFEQLADKEKHCVMLKDEMVIEKYNMYLTICNNSCVPYQGFVFYYSVEAKKFYIINPTYKEIDVEKNKLLQDEDTTVYHIVHNVSMLEVQLSDIPCHAQTQTFYIGVFYFVAHSAGELNEQVGGLIAHFKNQTEKDIKPNSRWNFDVVRFCKKIKQQQQESTTDTTQQESTTTTTEINQ